MPGFGRVNGIYSSAENEFGSHYTSTCLPELNQQERETVKSFSSQGAIEELENLSLDFDPRDLVVRHTSSPSRLGHRETGLQAIYVPSKSRTEQVLRLLAGLGDLGVPIYVLPTIASDLPIGMASNWRVESLFLKDQKFLRAMRGLRCHSNPLFAVPAETWDLPLKRNYALWHAYKHRFRRILLLDDDIRGLSATRLRAGASALDRWNLAGFFVNDFPDTSMIGHVELAIGEPVSPFLSGSCLFVRTEVPVGPFPAIYNEDWIYMAPEIAQGRVVSIGSVNQEPHDPFARVSLAAFQEPGEILADGLFALLAADRYEERRDPAAWRTLLSLRRSWLERLAGRVSDPRHRATVDFARAAGEAITEMDCVRFIDDWEQDRLQWIDILQGLT